MKHTNRAEELARRVRAARRGQRRDNHAEPLHRIRLVRPGSIGPVDPRRAERRQLVIGGRAVDVAPIQEEAFRPRVMLRLLILLAMVVGMAIAVRAVL
jgi:hypothetical protein